MDWSTLLLLFERLKESNDEKSARLLWKARLATDIELYASYYFPHYCGYAFNEFHGDQFNAFAFMEKAIRRARAAPRGYAKSTLTALIKPIHDVCYGTEDFIVIISNTQSQADDKLKDIRTEVLTNERLAADYGVSFPRKNIGETKFVVHAGNHRCLFQSFGSGVEIRGLRFGAKRPTKIILDDAEHSEEVHNEALRKKFEDWFHQVVGYLGSNDTNIEVIGTLLHKESLLNKLLVNPSYDSKKYRAVISWSERQDLWDQWTQIYTNLDNPNRMAESDLFYRQNQEQMLKGTKVLWPEKEPYIYLMKEMIEKGKRAFMKEKQNEPTSSEQSLFEKFHFYRETPDGILIESSGVTVPWERFRNEKGQYFNAYGALDPSTGQVKAKAGKLGDFSCILTGLHDSQKRLLVHSDWTKRAAPTKYIAQVFEHHEEYNYQKFGVETNLYRNLLLPNMVQERKEREKVSKKIIQLPFYDIENVDNKEKRIYTLEPKVTHGWILFNRALSQEFMGQLEAYPIVDHDDGPDTLEMLWGLVNNRYKASSVSVDAMGAR